MIILIIIIIIIIVIIIIIITIISFPAGTSGGPDGLISQHLKDLVADNTNSKLEQ